MALSVGNARAAASPHQDEVPYATGNSVRYDKTPTFRAQVKPVFIQIGGGEDFTPTATPTPALDESTFNPTVVRNEVSIPYSWPDEAFPRIPAEVENWAAPFVVPQIPVAPVWDHQDEVAQTPVTPALEESEFVGAAVAQSPFLWLEQAQDEIFLGTVDWSEWSPEPPPPAPRWSLWQDQDEVAVTPPTFGPEEFAWITYPDRGQILPDSIVWVEDDVFESIREESVFDPVWTPAKPFTQVFSAQEEIVQQGAVPQGGGGLVYDEISIFRWYQEDPLPILATPLGIDEEPWNPPVLSLEGPKWQYFPDEVIGPEAINGTSATINANDTSNASGTTTIVGSATNTNNDDTSNASGTTTIVGTSTTTNADDTSNASGSIGGTVSGDSATTNNDDTSSANGTTTIVGTSSTTNENDTNSATGTSIVNGSAADTNNNDTSAASGSSGTPPAGGTHTLPMTGVGPS